MSSIAVAKWWGGVGIISVLKGKLLFSFIGGGGTY